MSNDKVLSLQKYFLSVSDLNFLNWTEILEKFDVDYDTCLLNQEILLRSVVKHPLNVKYPIKLSYQQHFLKKFISLLEGRGLELSENLYTCYLDLLKQSDNEASSHYRHFQLPNNKFVSLSERKSFISDGTTGLYSWQGSFALSEWLIENHKELAGKTVLELGSGTGLAGLILLSIGKPESYYFSDCHPEVLKQLRTNIILNSKISSDNVDENEEILNNDIIEEVKDNRVIYWETKCNECEVKILNLPWEYINDYDVKDIQPDFVIASDVVYDEGLFTPLCNTLEFFLNRNLVYALLVCTVRNEMTFRHFCELLVSRKFSVAEVPLVNPDHIPFSLETPITLLKIQAPAIS